MPAVDVPPVAPNPAFTPSEKLDLMLAAARRSGVTIGAATKTALTVSSRYGAARLGVQREQLARLDDLLPLPRIELPRLVTSRLAPDDLEVLVDALGVEGGRPATPARGAR